MGRLQGKSIVITGGAGGIGAAAGKLFAQEGAKVLLVDVEKAALERAVAGCESPAVSYAVADVSDANQTKAYIHTALERHGGLDVLFANAGIEGESGPLTTMREDNFNRLMEVNVRGVWLGIREAAPHIEARGRGSIILTSSVAGLAGAANLGAYVTSKHALVGLMKAAALELAPKIRVNSVHPGPINNRMMRSIESQMAPDAPNAVRQGFEAKVPLGRYGENNDIAQLALFLASDESGYCTGATFVADGGYLAQ